MGPLELQPVKLENPYDVPGGVWLKGNLHTHSTVSDGGRDPQEIVDDYSARGYDFLMFSDHDRVTDVSELDARGMVLIPGNEVSSRGSHMLHVDASRAVEPAADRQAVIDAINDDGGFAVINHPNWEADYAHCPLEMMKALRGYLGIEIYNAVCDLLPGSAYAVCEWDRLLSLGRRVWGFASDDSHGAGQVGGGWVVARASARTREAVVDALRAGAFYASR